MNPVADQDKLPELLRRAVFDAEIKRLLFDDPTHAVTAFGLNAEDERRLRHTSRADFETAVGKFVLYKLVPVHIGERLWIIPDNENGNGHLDGLEIMIDQSETGASIGAEGISENKGRVFGSGTHPTTRLCVHMLEKYLTPGMRVLDLGTGSGILSLVAARLGAGEVIGLDVDPRAVEIARNNTERNGLKARIQIQCGDARYLRSQWIEPFDLVVSNILAEVHIESLGQGLLNLIRPHGHLILSGMQRTGALKVVQALRRAGFPTVDYARMEPWIALMAQRYDGKAVQEGRDAGDGRTLA